MSLNSLKLCGYKIQQDSYIVLVLYCRRSGYGDYSYCKPYFSSPSFGILFMNWPTMTDNWILLIHSFMAHRFCAWPVCSDWRDWRRVTLKGIRSTAFTRTGVFFLSCGAKKQWQHARLASQPAAISFVIQLKQQQSPEFSCLIEFVCGEAQAAVWGWGILCCCVSSLVRADKTLVWPWAALGRVQWTQ